MDVVALKAGTYRASKTLRPAFGIGKNVGSHLRRSGPWFKDIWGGNVTKKACRKYWMFLSPCNQGSDSLEKSNARACLHHNHGQNYRSRRAPAEYHHHAFHHESTRPQSDLATTLGLTTPPPPPPPPLQKKSIV
jgi:hypothetical protein